jgi:hypothetical protein
MDRVDIDQDQRYDKNTYYHSLKLDSVVDSGQDLGHGSS